jgi:tRNA pseudouridine38-40 synthase
MTTEANPACPRVALLLAYEGTLWAGWQTQPGANTIQDQLEAALASLCGVSVATICAGRTDAGVHASHQVVHFDCPVERSDTAFTRGLNALLPDSISVLHAERVSPRFHARFNAIRRRYVYRLWRAPHRHALHTRYATWVHQPLDVAAMQLASEALIGEHDFSSFRSSQCQAASPLRTMHSVRWREEGPLLEAEFVANAFLHHMIRNLMGSLLWVGAGKRPVSWLAEVLARRDRRLAAMTAPAQGLCLAGVDYGSAITMPTWP